MNDKEFINEAVRLYRRADPAKMAAAMEDSWTYVSKNHLGRYQVGSLEHGLYIDEYGSEEEATAMALAMADYLEVDTDTKKPLINSL